MHQLFAIDALLQQICSHLTRFDLCTLSRVSIAWGRCAIPFLYRDVDIQHALGPLGKVVYRNQNLEFANFPFSDENFQRFSLYSKFVRSLTFIHPEVASLAVQARRKGALFSSQYLFPNLQSLVWHCPAYTPESIDNGLGLISPKLNHLALIISDPRVLDYIVSLLSIRTPPVDPMERLVIRDDTEITGIGIPSSLTRPLKDLLTLCAHSLTLVDLSLVLGRTPSIIHCLAGMPSLSSLAIMGDTEEDPIIEEESRKIDKSQGFISLSSILFDNRYQVLYNMYLNPYLLNSLASVDLKTTPPDLISFMTYLVETCPNLTSLLLGERQIVNTATATAFIWPLTHWDAVEPLLLRLNNLSALSINWMLFSVTLNQLIEFLKARRTWIRFQILSAEPFQLQDMLTYAEHCPDLEHLGIHINIPGDLYIDDLPPEGISTFAALKSIDFACSNIPDSVANVLAIFLYRTCKRALFQIRGLNINLLNNVLKRLGVLYIEEARRKCPGSIREDIEKYLIMLIKR